MNLNGSGQTRRVLLVDDDLELQKLLQGYLAQHGFDVYGTTDASDVERLLQRQRPDVLVLDLMLPGEDGLSLCRRLRAAGAQLPIVMLTARDEPSDRIVGLELGADLFQDDLAVVDDDYGPFGAHGLPFPDGMIENWVPRPRWVVTVSRYPALSRSPVTASRPTPWPLSSSASVRLESPASATR